MGKCSRNNAVAAICGLALGAAILLVAGCNYPKPIRTCEYVTAYDRMTDRYDPEVSLVYMPDQNAFRGTRAILIGSLQVGQDWVESREEAIHYATYFRYVLQCELWKLKSFEFVALDTGIGADDTMSGGTLRFEGMITKFDMGSGFLRYLSPFLFMQLGATDFQIEGRITDVRSGQLVMEFVDRRRSLANTPFGPNPRNFTRGFAMKHTMKTTAECLAAFMGRAAGESVVAGATGSTSYDEASDS